MEITIGSDHNNDIILDHPSVGRKHARVTVKEDRYYVLEDLDSKNGIRINGRRIRKKRLQAGDEIILSVMEHHANIVPWHILREQIGFNEARIGLLLLSGVVARESRKLLEEEHLLK